MRQSLISPIRLKRLHEVFLQCTSKPCRLLEIGTWYALGSTQLWLNHIPHGSQVVLLDQWKTVDFTGISDGSTFDYELMNSMMEEAMTSTMTQVRRFEIMRPDLEIILIRANSMSSFIELLEPASFDFIFIDGNHRYSQVKSDLRLAKKLINQQDGIISGDDLELFPTQELLSIAKEHAECDWVTLPPHGGFHPGVLLAISEELPNVKMCDGIWWYKY